MSNVRFHVYVRPSKGKEVALGAVDSRSAHVAAVLHARRVGVPVGELETLALRATLQPLVKHRGQGVTVWAVPTIA